MSNMQLESILIIMFALLGFCFLIIKEKTISKKVKLRVLIVITLICIIGTTVVKMNTVPPDNLNQGLPHNHLIN